MTIKLILGMLILIGLPGPAITSGGGITPARMRAEG
jgi:hypothetical protein